MKESEEEVEETLNLVKIKATQAKNTDLFFLLIPNSNNHSPNCFR